MCPKRIMWLHLREKLWMILTLTSHSWGWRLIEFLPQPSKQRKQRSLSPSLWNHMVSCLQASLSPVPISTTSQSSGARTVVPTSIPSSNLLNQVRNGSATSVKMWTQLRAIIIRQQMQRASGRTSSKDPSLFMVPQISLRVWSTPTDHQCRQATSFALMCHSLPLTLGIYSRLPTQSKV